MASELVPLSIDKIMQSKSYTVIVLGTEKKKFAIYTERQVGERLQEHLTHENKPRPLTHDLINSIFLGLNIKVLQIVINDVQDTVYFARLFLEQEVEGLKQILEIDARPSDCLSLAIMNNVPVFCRREILEKAIPAEE